MPWGRPAVLRPTLPRGLWAVGTHVAFSGPGQSHFHLDDGKCAEGAWGLAVLPPSQRVRGTRQPQPWSQSSGSLPAELWQDSSATSVWEESTWPGGSGFALAAPTSLAGTIARVFHQVRNIVVLEI